MAEIYSVSSETGRQGERQAAAFLAKKGYRIACMNYRCKAGEIDIIAYEDQVLCFIEVKKRKDEKHGFPCESVNSTKRRRILRTAAFYLFENKLADQECRIDVIEIVGIGRCGYIRHLKNAFTLEAY